jgi:hypothetical protein
MYDREGFVFPEHLIEFAAIPDVAYLSGPHLTTSA